MIGNKSDLEGQRDVTYEEAKQFAEENGKLFLLFGVILMLQVEGTIIAFSLSLLCLVIFSLVTGSISNIY